MAPAIDTAAGGQESAVLPGSVHRPKDRPWLWYVAIGATVIFLVIFSVFVFRLTTTVEQQNQQVVASNRAFRELNLRFVELRNELARKEDLLRVLSSARTEVVYLKGHRVTPAATGKILMDPEKRSAILQVSNLPVVPEGKEYQLWVVRGDRQVSAGVFSVTAGGSSLFRVDRLPVFAPLGPASVIVTLEPRGGVRQPRGEVYLSGTSRL